MTTGTFDLIILSLTSEMTSPLRFMTTYNLSVSDEAIVELLKISDGAPLTYMSVDNARLTGEGRWEPSVLYTSRKPPHCVSVIS